MIKLNIIETGHITIGVIRKMKNLTIVFLLFLQIFTAASFALTDLSSVRMPFIKNVGQVPKHVAYYVNTPKASIFIDTQGTINYQFRHNAENKSLMIKESLVNGKPVLSLSKKQATQINIIKGKDHKKWHKNIPSALEISLGEVWKDIEVKLVTKPGNIEKIFTLKPYAKVNQINISLTGIV